MTLPIAALSLAVVAVFVVERASAAWKLNRIKEQHSHELRHAADVHYHRGFRHALLSSTKSHLLTK